MAGRTMQLERDALAGLICQANGVLSRLGFEFIIGTTRRNEAVCLVWNGEQDSEVTSDLVERAAKEVTAAGMKLPFRIYGTSCRIANTTSWRFCQIPEEILVQMRLPDGARE